MNIGIATFTEGEVERRYKSRVDVIEIRVVYSFLHFELLFGLGLICLTAHVVKTTSNT